MPIVPTYEAFCRKAEEGNLIPVYQEILADLETPVSAYLKIGGPFSYLLESVEGGEKWARYTFLGSDPEVIISSKGRERPSPETVWPSLVPSRPTRWRPWRR